MVLSSDIAFRNAILISLAIHFCVLLPLHSHFLVKDAPERKDSIIIDYIVPEEPALPVPDLKLPETPKLDINHKAGISPAQAVPRADRKSVEAASRELAEKQAAVRSTQDYINYYQLIREKIRQRLKSHYKRYHREGEIRVAFVLRSDGTLVSYGADRAASGTDTALVDIALKSLKEASPFPSFPKSVDLPSMSFDVTVAFKKE